MNLLFSFLFWLAGVLQLIGMIGGLLFWIVLGWMVFTQRGRHALQQLWDMPEYRCHSCSFSWYCFLEKSGLLHHCRVYVEDDSKEKKP